MKKVISIDGGGVRGIVPAYILMCIEDKLPGKLGDYVDLVAGTSTGAIVAAGVSAGVPMREVLDIYFKEAPSIFAKTFKTRRKSIFGLRGGKHDVHNLISILERYYGSGSMDDHLDVDFLCAAWDMTDGRPKIFTKQRHGHLPLGRVVAASASAPTYFNPTEIESREYLDGGIFAGNPSMLAFTEIKELSAAKAEDVLLISIGTGNRSKGTKSVKKWWKWQWIKLIDIMMASDGGVVDYELAQIYRATNVPGNYYRIQGKLPETIDKDMGSAKEGNLENLLQFAKSLAVEFEDEINSIVLNLQAK